MNRGKLPLAFSRRTSRLRTAPPAADPKTNPRTKYTIAMAHSCATLLLLRGVQPKFVQELLGHATIAITLDTYSHVMPSMGDATAKVMDDALA